MTVVGYTVVYYDDGVPQLPFAIELYHERVDAEREAATGRGLPARDDGLSLTWAVCEVVRLEDPS